MVRNYQRTPKNYDGTKRTAKSLHEVLPGVLHQVQRTYQDRPDLVLASWPDIIGVELSAMAQAVGFVDGVLTVKVKNSTLYSLLNQHEKPRILKKLKQRFPSIEIKTVMFRIG